MDATLAALEAALAADPTDVARLSALADYLLEVGDARGEWLQLMLSADAPGPSPADRRRLLAAADRLWADRWVGWMGPLAPFADLLTPLAWHYCWLRGVQTAALPPGLVAAVAASPLLTTLVVRPDDPAHVGDDGVDHLVHGGGLAHLTALELISCGITDDGAAVLAPAAGRLQSLRLDGNLLSPIGFAALAARGRRDLGPQAFGLPAWADGGADD